MPTRKFSIDGCGAAVRRMNPGIFGAPPKKIAGKFGNLSAGTLADAVRTLQRHEQTGPGALESLVAAAAAKSPYRSKLEAAFHEELRRRRVENVEYEPLRLKLAKRAHYTPDFVSRTDHRIEEDGSDAFKITCWEVKGHWREAARVRIKVAARLFPWMRFVAVTRKRKKDGGGWVEEVFTP